jgi:hypothetical protein
MTVRPLQSAWRFSRNELSRKPGAVQSRWSGTVVVNGRHITFKTDQGPWATLVRHGDHLYGVANDPLTEMDIMIDFARART